MKKLLANDGEFTFKRVISQTKEPIPCQGDKCSKQAISSWESNLNPEDNWDLCERCQVDYIGGSTKKRRLSTADSNDDDNSDGDDALVQQKENMNYFENHFGVPFPAPSKEEKNNIVTVIPKSHPTEIFKACVNNASMSLALDSPEHDHTFCQADGGKLPVTDQFYEAITKTGHGICHVFKEKSWKNTINKADYYEHDFTPEIPEDLAGGIRCHGLMPLQSKKKNKHSSPFYFSPLFI